MTTQFHVNNQKISTSRKILARQIEKQKNRQTVKQTEGTL